VTSPRRIAELRRVLTRASPALISLLRALRPAAAAIIVAVASATAGAHSFGTVYNLPVPFWMYAYGATAALVVSFADVAYFARMSATALPTRVRAYAPGGIGNMGPGLDVLGCAVTGAGEHLKTRMVVRDERQIRLVVRHDAVGHGAEMAEDVANIERARERRKQVVEGVEMHRFRRSDVEHGPGHGVYAFGRSSGARCSAGPPRFR